MEGVFKSLAGLAQPHPRKDSYILDFTGKISREKNLPSSLLAPRKVTFFKDNRMKRSGLCSRATFNYYKIYIKANSHSEYVPKVTKPKVEVNY